MRRRRYKGSRCGTRFHPWVQGVQHEATLLQGFSCDTRFRPSVQYVQHEATPRQGFTCDTRLHPSVQGVQHGTCAWAGNYGILQKIVALHLQPHWKKLYANLRSAAQGVHASVNGGAHWAA